MEKTGSLKKGKHWYAVYTASRAEKKVKERFEQAGIKCYLPLHTVERIWSDRKKKIEVPVINGYIFVHITDREIEQVQYTQGVAFLLKEKGKPVVIPDSQIDTLRFMVERVGEQIEFSVENLLPGMPVTVIRGHLEGLIGELIEIRGKYKIVLRMDSLGNAMVTIPVSSVKKMQ